MASDEDPTKGMSKSEQFQQFEQNSAMMADVFPVTWRRIYVNLVREGFTEEQSLSLLKAYIAGMAGGGAKV